MHISIVRFPTVTDELDKDFRDWFTSSDGQLRGSAGLKGRRLLRAPDGSYTAVMEHESAGTFAAVHAAEAVSMVRSGLGHILSECPPAMTYEDVVASATSGGCSTVGQATGNYEDASQTHVSVGCCGRAAARALTEVSAATPLPTSVRRPRHSLIPDR